MRTTALLALAAATLLGTEAIHLVERRDAAPAVVGIDIQRSHVEDPVQHDRLRRRAKTVTQTLDNLKALYFANASLGTPPQSFRFHIDTGSSDLWTNAPSSRLCLSRSDPCSDSGSYDANQSSTYEFVDGDFNISYADGSGASGDYATDTILFGGATIPGLQFGIGYRSTSPEGVLGIGYPSHEAQVILTGAKPYPNLPQLMVSGGLIQSPAFSLWLNDLDASTGSILFGGVNTEKYHGTLASLPIQLERGAQTPQEFFVTLTGLKFGKQALGGDRADAVLLDSGSSLIYLPDDLALATYKAVGAQIDRTKGLAVVPCSLAKSKQTLNFTFSGPTISVDMSELVLPSSRSSSAFDQDQTDSVCTFGILPTGGSNPVLGDPFLRSAYVVYDMANNQISLAQTNFNATKDRILEIGTGSKAVPDAKGVDNPTTAQAPSTGGGRIRPTAVATATPTKTGGAANARTVPTTALAAIMGVLGLGLAL